jgi:predicted phosphoadenosine phosphosulfate sulfurtransferase
LNVFDAANDRISWVFDTFPKIYVSFSGGKDSTAMLHMVMSEAKIRKRKVGVLFIDWECQFNMTIDHVRELFHLYKDNIEPYWIQLEILTNNATSMIEPTWKSWDESKKQLWTREKEPIGTIKDRRELPFYFDNITFEEFVPLFAKWYSNNEPCACFVGIRAQESLNRFRAVARDINRKDGKNYTVNVVDDVWNIYPVYDWSATDIWTYYGKQNKPYNRVYDRMHQAGLTIHQMRIDEPFGDEARKNLWLYHIIEPKTWSRMVARMNGVNSGALYSEERGNVLGNVKISLPQGHTWESFSKHILNTMPPKTAEHYKNKIAVYLNWYRTRGYPDGIPDQADYRLEQLGKVPAWRQIAKVLLRNDYWCRGIGFSITKSSAYGKYMELMKRRRSNWGLFND